MKIEIDFKTDLEGIVLTFLLVAKEKKICIKYTCHVEHKEILHEMLQG